LLVLGMHRSGTSALTRVTSLLGASLPKTLLGATSGNPRGHWEANPLIAYNDRLLQKLGSHWDDWLALDLSRLRPNDLDEIKRDISDLIDEEYGTAPLFVVKEPRICRLTALYLDVLRGKGIEPRCLLPIRNPLAVMASLSDRDHMPQGTAGLLWLRHVLDAEHATRAMARAIVSYEALLSDWRATLARAGARISLRWPRRLDEAAEEIDAFLSRDLQHFAPSRRELAGHADVAAWIKQAYQALLDLEREPDDDRAITLLDEVRNEFEAGCAAFGSTLRAERQGREADVVMLRARLAAAEDRTSVLDGTIKGLSAQAAGRLEEIADLKAQLARRDAEIAELRTQAAARRPRLDVVSPAAAHDDDRSRPAAKE
jgi:hypothetical protein